MVLFPLNKLDKRREYADVFQAAALRLARPSRSTQATARALNIYSKHICQ